MRIGYAKLGRSMPLGHAKWGVTGGDDEPPLLLRTLAERHPQHEFVLVGRNSGEKPIDVDLPTNVTNPWTELGPVVKRELRGRDLRGITEVCDRLTLPLFRDLDALVVWQGQHGTSNTPIPTLGEPYDARVFDRKLYVSWSNYAGYILRGINAFRQRDPIAREEIWLCPDSRNTFICRDMKWPLRRPVLGQYRLEHLVRFERYTDRRDPAECGFPEADWYQHRDEPPHLWRAPVRYAYSRLELCGVLPEHVPSEFADNWHERRHFGMFVNEARAYVTHDRLTALLDYVLPLEPAFLHGTWSVKSQQTIVARGGPPISPAPAAAYYDLLRSVASTFTTPSSGSGWATTKPWQAFATGTVCFFHPRYDDQGWIIPTLNEITAGVVPDDELAHLALWLRVETPAQLAARVRAVSESEDLWRWLATAQRRAYDRACAELRHVNLIDDRLGLKETDSL